MKDMEPAAVRTRYFDFFTLAPVGFCSVGKQGLIVETNPAADTLLGAAAGSLINEPFNRFIHHEDRNAFRLYNKEVPGHGDPQSLELQMLKMDGTAFWAHLTATSAMNADGSPMIHTVIIDITGRKQAEKKLVESEAKHRYESSLMRSMCDSVPDMIWAKDLEKRYVFANKALCSRLLNADDTDEPLGKTTLFFAERERLRHADNPEWHTFDSICRHTDALTMESGTPLHFDDSGKVRGKFLFLDILKAPFIDQTGKMIGTVGSARDVTTAKEMEQRLNQREAQMRAITDSARDGILMIDRNGIISYWNPAAVRIFGYARKEAIGKNLHLLLAPQRYQEAHQAAFAGFRQTGRVNAINSIIELEARHKDGHEITVELSLSSLHFQDGWHSIGIIRDITDRKQAEAVLQESEENHRLLFENANDAIFIVDMNAQMLAVNSTSLRLLCYTREELMSMTVYQVNSPKNRQRIQERIEMLMEQGCLTFETEHLRKDGSLIPVEISARRITWDGKPAIMSISRDISERKLADETRKTALQEKEVLLREIHHRVKNNMQVISSLLHLQASRVKHEQARQALIESQQRILAMAMIHETLYGGQNLATIDLCAYLKRLVHYLQGAYGTQADIRFCLELDPVELDINQAVPCSLILNEIITNAFKHAFPDGKKGTVRIKLHSVNDREVLLEISDNGVGITADPDLGNPATLGLMLVQRLLKKQLKGSLSMVSEGGTAFTLRWPLPG